MENFSNYEINPIEGSVFSKISKRFIGSKSKKNGYIQVGLIGDDGKVYYYQLHRLIYESVNGKIQEGYDIHHKDHDRENNRIENLECIDSFQHNSMHKKGFQHSELTKKKMSQAMKGENNPRSKAVAKLDKTTNEVLEILPYVKKFEELYDFDSSHISACCLGKRNTANGFKWKYIE